MCALRLESRPFAAANLGAFLFLHRLDVQAATRVNALFVVFSVKIELTKSRRARVFQAAVHLALAFRLYNQLCATNRFR